MMGAGANGLAVLPAKLDQRSSASSAPCVLFAMENESTYSGRSTCLSSLAGFVQKPPKKGVLFFSRKQARRI